MIKSLLKQSSHFLQLSKQAKLLQGVLGIPKIKDVVLFDNSLLKGMRMKDLNSCIKSGKIYIKPFFDAKLIS